MLSVFNGFEGIVKDLYSNFYTDLKISAVTGKTIILSPGQVKKIKDLSSIKNFSLVAEEKALIQNGDYQALTSLKGVDENYQYVSGVANNLTANATYSIGSEEAPKLIDAVP